MKKTHRMISFVLLLLMMVSLFSSCDLGDLINQNQGTDDTSNVTEQTTPGDGTTTDNGEVCAHDYSEWVIVLESICIQKGKQVRVCALCKHVESMDLDLKSHTIETIAKTEPTCTVEGKTEGEKCSVCSAVLKEQESIATIPHNYEDGKCTMCEEKEPDCYHTYGEWVTVQKATCAAEGLEERVCTTCSNKEQRAVVKTAHTEVIDKAVSATCTTTGLTQGKHCSICDYIILSQKEVKAKGHTYVEGVCHCGEKDENYVPAKKYTVVFKDHDGTVLSTQSVKEGAGATAPKTPARNGYEFIGWDKSFNKVTSDITVTAMYQKISTEPQFVVSSMSAGQGDTVEVTVKLKNNPGIASIILSMAYDSEALTLTEVVYNNAIGGQTVQPQTMNSPVKLYWINGFADAEGDFVLATLKFTVKSDAAVGDHNITLRYNADDVYDISETNIAFEIVNGKILVS